MPTWKKIITAGDEYTTRHVVTANNAKVTIREGSDYIYHSGGALLVSSDSNIETEDIPCYLYSHRFEDNMVATPTTTIDYIQITWATTSTVVTTGGLGSTYFKASLEHLDSGDYTEASSDGTTHSLTSLKTMSRSPANQYMIHEHRWDSGDLSDASISNHDKLYLIISADHNRTGTANNYYNIGVQIGFKTVWTLV